MTHPLRLAALISGGGRTMINLADRIDDGTLPASIKLVIASRNNIAGIRRAQERGLLTKVVCCGDFANESLMHDAITKLLLEDEIDLVCLCGYLRLMRVDEPFRWKAINIHPALLPDFGGHGMFGLRVHQAVLAAGRTESGCTVHFVDEKYDHGPIILQRTCPVVSGDTTEALAARVFEQECLAYPAAIRLIAENRVRIENNRVILDSPSN